MKSTNNPNITSEDSISLLPPKHILKPLITLSRHFSSSKFQEKLLLENKVAMFKLKIISIVCCSFMIIEFICGYLAGSLAIMSDATHLLSDLAGFLISLFSLNNLKFPRREMKEKSSHSPQKISEVNSSNETC